MNNLIIDIDRCTLQAEEKEIIKHPYVGGVILFTRNYETPAQISALIHDIRRCKKKPLLIAVDQEGGRVQRFKQPLTTLPPARYFGETYAKSPELALSNAETIGHQMALELRELGVDFSFAPVLDLDWQKSEVIGNRAFHADPLIVSHLAGAFMRGMSRANMLAVGKHFPGHGWVTADSHTDIPIDTRNWETIWNHDVQPFKALIAQGLNAIMPAHVIYSECDKHPAGFSTFWLQKILREKLNFKGTIYSDDLSMKGASVISNIVDRVKTAFIAGCNKILICNDRPSVIQVLDEPLLFKV